MAFVSWLEIILAVSMVSVDFNCLVITTAAILEVIVNQGDAMEAGAFGDGFRLVDASVACLVATTAILEPSACRVRRYLGSSYLWWWLLI